MQTFNTSNEAIEYAQKNGRYAAEPNRSGKRIVGRVREIYLVSDSGDDIDVLHTERYSIIYDPTPKREADQPTTKVTHTPGPWRFKAPDSPNAMSEVITKVGSDNEYRIAWVLRDSNPHQQPIDDANAHVIAAAPDMLEALEETLSWIVDSFTDEDDQPQGIVSRAQAAIAKAKGGAA